MSMTEKEKKPKRINLSLTEKQYEEITSAAEELGISFSSYCVQAIEKSLGKVQKLDPKTLTIDPVDIYTDDVMEGLNKIGSISSKLNRLLYTLSTKESAADFEMKRLSDLTLELKEAEKEFGAHMETVYEDRVKLRKDILKKVDKKIKKLTEEGRQKEM